MLKKVRKLEGNEEELRLWEGRRAARNLKRGVLTLIDTAS